MSAIRLIKRNVLGILAGIGVVIGAGVAISGIGFFLSYQLYQVISPQDIESGYSQTPYVIFYYLSRTASLLVPVFGGFVTGRIVKERGWLYGAMVSIILLIISLSIVSISFLLVRQQTFGYDISPDYGKQIILKNIINQLTHAPLDIVLSALGGYMGEVYSDQS